MKPTETERDILSMLRTAKGLAVLSAWNELGLLDLLADGPVQIDSLPADSRALATTIPVLRHLGLLTGDAHVVGLSKAGKRLVDEAVLPSGRHLEQLRELSRMTDVLRDGGPVRGDDGEEHVTDGGVLQHDPEATAIFLDRLYDWAAHSAGQVFEWMAEHVPERARVLDVGGGHGRYLRRFVDAGHVGTLFDFAHVIEYCRGRHGDALSYLAGNFRDEHAAFGGPYDLILLSNIVHGEPDNENRSLIARLAKVLAPGGIVMLKDMFIDAHGAYPEEAVFFGLTMLFYTRAGQSPTIAQSRSWLEDAGLAEVHVSLHDRYQLVWARR